MSAGYLLLGDRDDDVLPIDVRHAIQHGAQPRAPAFHGAAQERN